MQGLACGLLHLHADCTPSGVIVLHSAPNAGCLLQISRHLVDTSGLTLEEDWK